MKSVYDRRLAVAANLIISAFFLGFVTIAMAQWHEEFSFVTAVTTTTVIILLILTGSVPSIVMVRRRGSVVSSDLFLAIAFPPLLGLLLPRWSKFREAEQRLREKKVEELCRDGIRIIQGGGIRDGLRMVAEGVSYLGNGIEKYHGTAYLLDDLKKAMLAAKKEPIIRKAVDSERAAALRAYRGIPSESYDRLHGEVWKHLAPEMEVKRMSMRESSLQVSKVEEEVKDLFFGERVRDILSRLFIVEGNLSVNFETGEIVKSKKE